jgi:hypothetical protein
MGEDFPLDPEQVRLPQEEQAEQQDQRDEATHIEVAHHDEAQASENEPAQSESIDPDASSHGKEVPSSYVRNKEKAEVMAHAQNDTIDENRKLEKQGRYDDLGGPEWSAERAGRDYEIQNALARYKHEGVNTPEEAVRLARHDRDMFLKYSHAIAENHRKHGDELSVGLEAADKVYEYQQRVIELGGDKAWAFEGYRISTVEDNSVGNIGGLDTLLVRNQSEEWTLSMFEGGEYMVSSIEFNPDAEFQEVQTIKKRTMTKQDVGKLDETLSGWIENRKTRQEREKQRQYSEQLEAYEEERNTEDPLAGDVDRFVHPDETRTDGQIAQDEKHKVEPY